MRLTVDELIDDGVIDQQEYAYRNRWRQESCHDQVYQSVRLLRRDRILLLQWVEAGRLLQLQGRVAAKLVSEQQDSAKADLASFA